MSALTSQLSTLSFPLAVTADCILVYQECESLIRPQRSIQDITYSGLGEGLLTLKCVTVPGNVTLKVNSYHSCCGKWDYIHWHQKHHTTTYRKKLDDAEVCEVINSTKNVSPINPTVNSWIKADGVWPAMPLQLIELWREYSSYLWKMTPNSAIVI